MAVLFALISSLSWGTADFLGGLASRRVGALRVLSVSYPAGGVLITILALLVVPGVLSSESVWVGVTSGAVGALGMGLLYAALAQGQMGIVSPITAVLSGAVPVLAVILVSRETGPHKKTPPRAIAIAIASGLAIGAYLSVLGSAPDDSGIWVATIGRWFSSILVVIALIIWLVRTGAGWSSAGSFPWSLAVAAGGLDALANAVFQLAAQRGLLAIVAVIGSLYPAATLLLARFLLHERISRRSRNRPCLQRRPGRRLPDGCRRRYGSTRRRQRGWAGGRFNPTGCGRGS